MQNASIFNFVNLSSCIIIIVSFAYGEPLAINPSSVFLHTKRQTTALVNEDENIMVS